MYNDTRYGRWPITVRAPSVVRKPKNVKMYECRIYGIRMFTD